MQVLSACLEVSFVFHVRGVDEQILKVGMPSHIYKPDVKKGGEKKK